MKKKHVVKIIQSDFWPHRCLVVTIHGDKFYRTKKYLKRKFTQTEFKKLYENDKSE